MQDQVAGCSRYSTYQSPLGVRYASEEMKRLFSAQNKYATWRMLWVALAEAEQELGLPITDEQIEELKQHSEEIDFQKAATYEETFGHDVVAHIHTLADLCPQAKPIIHLGATSCFVTDNADLIVMRKGLLILQRKITALIEELARFAKKFAATACLSYTHFQPAQLTTVGKRACLWLHDFICDYSEISTRIANLHFLGVKGATGTQSAFLSLFSGDHAKVKLLDKLVAEKMGFSRTFPITGQTYPRKLDAQILHTLASFAASAHKMGTDIRLLAGLQEVEEPFSDKQVGSSAMPYKRNPILTERITSLSRFLIALSQNGDYTHALQWLERSLDDSAIRRLSLPEGFLAADAIAGLLMRVCQGLHVNEKVLEKRINEALPFMATENILMEAVKKGGDRQALHEKLRLLSRQAADDNSLLEKIAEDKDFALSQQELAAIVDVKKFTGRSEQQVLEFLEDVKEILAP